MDGVNNLSKKQVSCKDDSLPNGLQPEKIVDIRIWVIQFRTCVMKNYMEKRVIPLRIMCKAPHIILVLIP